ncbi:hypothetical protein AMTR_s00194p00015150 [Amborella trichopoda]|uniref:Uncharacterized protein n=1 Tax=Amborella trichopoda TaxID=13333 RepID=U5D9S5_AMBTC|nr:hypothetical protein AMTR_s00194p00015150 [Amborella trichopoda]
MTTAPSANDHDHESSKRLDPRLHALANPSPHATLHQGFQKNRRAPPRYLTIPIMVHPKATICHSTKKEASKRNRDEAASI